MFSVLLLCVVWCACAVVAWRAYWRRAHPLPPPMPGGIPIIGHTHLFSGDTTKIWDLLNQMTEECMKNGGVMHAQIGTQIYYGSKTGKLILRDTSSFIVSALFWWLPLLILVFRSCSGLGIVCDVTPARRRRSPIPYDFGIQATIAIQIHRVITDPEDALTVANTCLHKHFIYDYVRTWLGNGLLTSSGALWQRHRKLLSPAFSVPVIHNFLGVFNLMAKQFIAEVEPKVGNGPFEILSYLRLIAFQTVSRTAFGLADDNVNDFAREYMASADQLMNMVIHRFQNIWLHSDFIFRMTGLKSKEQRLLKHLDDIANRVIKRKKEDLKNSTEKVSYEWSTTDARYKPLLNLLLELKNDDTLSEKEIKEELDTALVAGFDTTSNTLTFILVLLGTYPEVQQKMYDEIMEVIGPDRDIEKDDIRKLVYMEAVIKEALRVLPIGPALLRYVEHDTKLKNYTMRAGSQCVILTLGTHRNALWGDDVNEFKPERWFDPAIASQGNTAFYGFSIGKRSCIGRTYAMISMKVTLSHFIRRFKISANVNNMRFEIDMVLKPTTAQISLENRS